MTRRAVVAGSKGWSGALRSATLTGAVAACTTGATVTSMGKRDSGSAAAPLNATSHIAWGESAGQVETVDAKHTLLGSVIHLGACIFWATVYERWFGRAAERGNIATALVGAGVVATAAYVTDYRLVPKRLTPGWEQRLSGESLAATYVVLALTLPLRGLLRNAR